MEPRTRGRARASAIVLWGAAALAGCTPSARKAAPSRVSSNMTVSSSRTTLLCRLEGKPGGQPGVYATDLGISFLHPQGNPGSPRADSRNVVMFGDTWKSATSMCDYPPRGSDDLQVFLPAGRPESFDPGMPSSDAGEHSACPDVTYPPSDPSDPNTPRPIRLFPDASDHSEDRVLDTSYSRTPLAGFSDGVHAFGVFIRNDPAECDTSADCPASMVCSADPAYSGTPLGVCDPSLQVTSDPAPLPCRPDADGPGDCGLYRTCIKPSHGACLEREPFRIQAAGGTIIPTWYADDVRRAVSLNLYVASAFWSHRPEDYATGFKFVTNKFANPAARTVAHFDPSEPSQNDYRPGTETLLMWGRPSFQGRNGFQALLFLLYQPLEDLLDDQGNIHWSPRYFAGYGDDGAPRWSADDADAVPVYGTDAAVANDGGKSTLEFTHPEFDLVNWMTMSFVQPLGRWVTLYGGDLPRWLRYDAAANKEIADYYAEPTPGAIHMRYASHPWGRATRDAPSGEAWTEPVPVLTRETAAPSLGCDDGETPLVGCSNVHDSNRPLQLFLEVDQKTNITQSDWPAVTQACLDGAATENVQYNLSGDAGGHLYAPEIIESWTSEVTSKVRGLGASDRAVELYFNVSTWNPYGTSLFRTELVGRVDR